MRCGCILLNVRVPVVQAALPDTAKKRTEDRVLEMGESMEKVFSFADETEE